MLRKLKLVLTWDSRPPTEVVTVRGVREVIEVALQGNAAPP